MRLSDSMRTIVQETKCTGVQRQMLLQTACQSLFQKVFKYVVTGEAALRRKFTSGVPKCDNPFKVRGL